MNAELVIVIVIVVILRKRFKTKIELPKWNRTLKYIFYAAITLIILNVFFEKWEPYTRWLAHALILYLIYILLVDKTFRGTRDILLAIAPLVLLLFLNDIAQLFSFNENKVMKALMETGIFFAFVWMFIMWYITNKQRRDLEKEKAKTHHQEEQKKIAEAMKEQLEVQVAERTAELTRQKEELQHTLDELKSTQAQLIHSEKMASLGELTAGIAHEIQNPLNFVNNFSEVSAELLDEMKGELATGNLQSAKEIAEDVKQNLDRINFHGKRAGEIVKGMLQHSRSGSGQKEPTDINNLCDEYLRLSYHGLRAKDKTFNADLKTELDPSVPKLSVVPQDIGRVVLNLITNGFYATQQKQKLMTEKERQDYHPSVSVKTSQNEKNVIIEISDNGLGMDKGILGKIFQPFFTTKPPGEGTGLGLSISFDIIKAHNGEIRVESERGRGTEFVIQLPKN